MSNISFFLFIYQFHKIINSQVRNFIIITGKLVYITNRIIVIITKKSIILYLIFGKLFLKG